MRYTLSSLLATLTICASASVMPAAAGNSGDANGMREQAQIHPDQVSQPPDYASGSVAQGEVCPSWLSRRALCEVTRRLHRARAVCLELLHVPDEL